MTTKRREPRLDLNPSSADRWTTCTASPRFIMEHWDKVPVSSDTVYNIEGSAAHEVAAATLQGQEPKPEYGPKSEMKTFEFTPDMIWHGWNYAEYVESLRQPGSKLLVEQKLPLWYMRERNAIVDAAVINPDSLHVIDYKYGEGVPVSPEGNLQTAIYGVVIGSMGQPLPTDFPVFIHIYQPRGRASEHGAEHVWKTTWFELLRLTDKVTQVATGIQDGTEIPMFAPSDKACQWCPAKGFCTARQASMADGFEVLSPEIMLTPKNRIPAVLDLERDVVPLLKFKTQMEKFLGDVQEWAQEFLQMGGKIPGFKLVQSRGGNRQWSDPQKAAALLLESTVLKREEVIEEKVIGPAAAEKLLGKGKFGAELMNLITKSEGVPVIAPEGDKREAIGSVTDDFEPILP